MDYGHIGLSPLAHELAKVFVNPVLCLFRKDYEVIRDFLLDTFGHPGCAGSFLSVLLFHLGHLDRRRFFAPLYLFNLACALGLAVISL